MTRLLGPLRVRLALVGFVAVYLPVVIMIVVLGASEVLADVEVNETSAGSEVVTQTNWTVVAVTAILLAPIAATMAWWLAGRALRPLAEAMVLQEQLIEETSHELRTPLSILSGNADVLLGHPDPTIEIYRTGLERSQAAARRMTATIDSLLVDARGRARTLERLPADLNDVVAQVIDGLQPVALDHGVTLSAHSTSAKRARIDAPSVERALSNLISNALQAAPAGSVVEVQVVESERTTTILVTDEGPGIDEADQPNVFERYWHGRDDDDGGTGIGLSIVRQVAVAHGGDVTVRSPVENGRGSQFCFSVVR